MVLEFKKTQVKQSSPTRIEFILQFKSDSKSFTSNLYN